MRYRLIASDLDDTLLDESSNISVRNREAIRRAVDLGVKFVIATGRMFKTSISYLEDLGLNSDCPVINYHEALVKKSRSREVILHRPIDNSVAISVAEEAERQGCHVSVFIEDELYIREENEYSRFYQSMAHIGLEEVGPLGAFLRNNGASPTKISIIRWDGTIDDIETKLRGKYGKKLSILQSRPYFLEITDQKATKGQTLGWLAEKEGIKPEEIIAFGDGHNDIDMLKFAGLGVAVSNGRPEVRAAARLVTGSNIENGVAEVIERYVLGLA